MWDDLSRLETPERLTIRAPAIETRGRSETRAGGSSARRLRHDRRGRARGCREDGRGPGASGGGCAAAGDAEAYLTEVEFPADPKVRGGRLRPGAVAAPLPPGPESARWWASTRRRLLRRRATSGRRAEPHLPRGRRAGAAVRGCLLRRRRLPHDALPRARAGAGAGRGSSRARDRGLAGGFDGDYSTVTVALGEGTRCRRAPRPVDSCARPLAGAPAAEARPRGRLRGRALPQPRLRRTRPGGLHADDRRPRRRFLSRPGRSAPTPPRR